MFAPPVSRFTGNNVAQIGNRRVAREWASRVHTSRPLMGKNVKHKGPNARAREREKGHKLGPKIIGATKPPNGLQPSYTGFSSKRFASKKAKKAAATAAAWALLANSDHRKGQRKHKFSY